MAENATAAVSTAAAEATTSPAAAAGDGQGQTIHHESIIAGDKPEAAPQDVSFFGVIMQNQGLILVVVALWAFALWSMNKQKKKKQEREAELNALKKGDHVVTIGGVHGVVVSLAEKTFTIKTDEKNGALITFDRRAVHEVQRQSKNDGGEVNS